MGQFGVPLAYNTRKNFFKLRGEVLRLKALSYSIDTLKTKSRLFYLKTQFVPRSKHFSCRL